MAVSRRDFLQLAGLQWSGARLAQPPTTGSGLATDDPQTLHVLKRLTWGVRPQDFARINELGIEGYIDWQLAPELIDDPQVNDFIAARRILNMSWQELIELINGNAYGQVLETVLWGRVFRAANSNRQLYELMVEFWTDHFNIPIADWLAEKTVDDREVVRTHAMGSFRELLFASARSAAMLYYLNNDSSSKEHPNENYAREIMELHTLGVDGGYTETDVKEVARALTGWTVDNGAFTFNRDMHDDGEKTVLGTVLAAGRGIEDGLQVLDLLATHPSTARFISQKLIRRFVSDLPPEALVNSAAEVFMNTGGNLREVMRHILISDEFMNAAGQKFHRPLDYVVAIMRALSPGLQIENPISFIYSLEPLGQIPFFWHPPNGYPDAAGAWINTNGLLQRWNLALNLALAGEGYFPGASLNLEAVVPIPATVGELVDAASERVLGGRVNDADRAQLIAFMGAESDTVTPDLYYTKFPGLLGLLLASPYFQWR